MDPYLCEEDFIQPLEIITPMCQGCGKKPHELPEYVSAAEESGTSPILYVMQEEGTYNRSNGHFLCTPCYVNAGMPTAGPRKRWVCP